MISAAFGFLTSPLGRYALIALAAAYAFWTVHGWGEAKVRQEWAAANARAREAARQMDKSIAAAADAKDDEISERLARLAGELKGRADDIETALRAADGCNADDVLDSLPGRDAGPRP